ncbi:GP46-like surface antigen, putative [Bodo saltans]|uniref:GP46-like surface antigen, putative n=1 Tax=Bodo saltans TaxID=75058 RepID=A0A0S4JEJ4_BODSA|nr:GP46-like surface antigen, putative [Bodo saltans]|eukprot:CUG88597.1 GP46-like surface antigen, putative [Bodo saltans]
MRSLNDFRISGNSLSGVIPTAFGLLPSMAVFSISNNDFSGILPVFSSTALVEMQLTRLNQFVVHNNSLSDTLPASYSMWSGVAFISLHTNQLEGTIPAAWPSSVLNLSDFRVANNSLTGTVPAAFGKLSFLTSFSISSNAFSGMLPGFSSSSLILVDIQHNPQLDATLPPKLQAWTTCHTSIPCTDSLFPMQYCMPRNYDLFSDAAKNFATIAPYAYHCTNAPQTSLEPSEPITTPTPQPSVISAIASAGITTLDSEQQTHPTVRCLWCSAAGCVACVRSGLRLPRAGGVPHQ